MSKWKPRKAEDDRDAIFTCPSALFYYSRHVHGLSATLNLARLARLGLVFVRKKIAFWSFEAGEKFDGPCLRYFGHGGLGFGIHGRPELVSWTYATVIVDRRNLSIPAQSRSNSLSLWPRQQV